jgi:hypothetical protein
LDANRPDVGVRRRHFLSGFAITKQYYRNVEEREFAAETARQADALNEGIKRYTDAVNAVATFVTASDRIVGSCDLPT